MCDGDGFLKMKLRSSQSSLYSVDVSSFVGERAKVCFSAYLARFSVCFFRFAPLFIDNGYFSLALVFWGLSMTIFHISTTISFGKLCPTPVAHLRLVREIVVIARWFKDFSVIFYYF
jgi:hypothetical protein